MQYVPNRTARFIRKALHCCVPLVICITITIPAHAQTLHALLVIMDADPDVGSAMQVNAEGMRYFLREVEEKGKGLQVETKTLLSSQNQARKGEITAWLDTREIADEDILLVYFSGKGRFAAPTEFLYLQDGGISHTELSKKVRDAGTGKLTLLITDRCNALLELPSNPNVHTDPLPGTTARLEDLFKKHEGFLHLTSATDREPGWANAKVGGLFTQALTMSILEPNHQGIASWEAVLKDSRQLVKETFENADLPEPMQETLREHGIQRQTPKAYRLPTPSETPAPADTDELWAFENPHVNFTVDLKTDKQNYLIDELINLGIEVTDSVHVFIFNWKNAGKFDCLFPNRFEDANLLAPGKIWSIPPRGAKYEIFAEAPGTEQFKILALRNAADSNAIQRMLIAAQTEKDALDSKRQPKHAGLQIEEQIVQYLRQMKPSDWAENRTTAEVKAPSPLEDDDFRKPDDDSGAHKNRPSDGNNRRAPDDVDKVDSNRHPNPVDIVFFKEGEYGSHAYLAQLTDPDNQDADKVDVHIFNAALREKYGETLPKAWIIRERTEPKEGWGYRSLMLNFYRNEAWIFTTDAVMHEDHYLLPEHLNGNGDPIQGDREVGFGDVRIPIPVAFERDGTDTDK